MNRKISKYCTAVVGAVSIHPTKPPHTFSLKRGQLETPKLLFFQVEYRVLVGLMLRQHYSMT